MIGKSTIVSPLKLILLRHHEVVISNSSQRECVKRQRPRSPATIPEREIRTNADAQACPCRSAWSMTNVILRNPAYEAPNLSRTIGSHDVSTACRNRSGGWQLGAAHTHADNHRKSPCAAQF
jgi:hypothetical protein